MGKPEDMNKPKLVESLPFEGKVNEIRVRRIESKIIPGGQVVVIYFNSIEGRNKPECVWDGQAPEKMDQYEERILALIKAGFKDYPAVIATVPPHAATLFAFGSPLLGHSEVNYYKLATLNVPDMSVKQESGQMPQLMGCPLDEAVIDYEYNIWKSIPKEEKNPLDKYAQATRNPQEIHASMADPNKMFRILQSSS